MMKYKAKLTCTIDANHPDRRCVPDWTPDKVFEFDDVYTFSNDYTKEEAKQYMKTDLKLVACGGYSFGHIHDVKFECEEMA